MSNPPQPPFTKGGAVVKEYFGPSSICCEGGLQNQLPPLVKGGGGDLRIQLRLDPSQDDLDHGCCFGEHLPAVETQDFQTQTCQILIPFLVSFLVILP